MNSYTLTATLNRKTHRKTIWTHWSNGEAGAMMEAVTHILEEANKNPTGAWAKGYIKLVNNYQGNVVAEMEAK